MLMGKMMTRMIASIVAGCITLFGMVDHVSAEPKGDLQLVMEIRADEPGHPINKTQYGVFFEEISHAGEEREKTTESLLDIARSEKRLPTAHLSDSNADFTGDYAYQPIYCVITPIVNRPPVNPF